jgi:hypothetical protein
MAAKHCIICGAKLNVLNTYLGDRKKCYPCGHQDFLRRKKGLEYSSKATPQKSDFWARNGLLPPSPTQTVGFWGRTADVIRPAPPRHKGSFVVVGLNQKMLQEILEEVDNLADTSRYCPQCGKSNKDAADFCEYCGGKFSAP